MPSPSDLLSAAADRVRDLAAQATKGPWFAFEDAVGMSVASSTTYAPRVVAGKAGQPDAAWVAAMSPEVAPHVEAWLRTAVIHYRAADRKARLAWSGSRDPGLYVGEDDRAALAFARSILGVGLAGETP